MEALEQAPPCLIRPVDTRGDSPERNFILKSWHLVARHESHLSWYIPTAIFSLRQQQRMKFIMARPHCMVLMACSPDPDTFVGFLVYEKEPQTIHFVYTKEAFRRQGIARQLVHAAQLDLTKPLIATTASFDTTKGGLLGKYQIDLDPDAAYTPLSQRSVHHGSTEEGARP